MPNSVAKRQHTPFGLLDVLIHLRPLSFGQLMSTIVLRWILTLSPQQNFTCTTGTDLRLLFFRRPFAANQRWCPSLYSLRVLNASLAWCYHPDGAYLEVLDLAQCGKFSFGLSPRSGVLVGRLALPSLRVQLFGVCSSRKPSEKWRTSAQKA